MSQAAGTGAGRRAERTLGGSSEPTAAPLPDSRPALRTEGRRGGSVSPADPQTVYEINDMHLQREKRKNGIWSYVNIGPLGEGHTGILCFCKFSVGLKLFKINQIVSNTVTVHLKVVKTVHLKCSHHQKSKIIM